MTDVHNIILHWLQEIALTRKVLFQSINEIAINQF